MDEKDRFGNKLREKQRADEDQFFAERDRALLDKMRSQSTEQSEATLRELARSRCPRCGHHLSPKKVEEVELDECTSCEGIWLDKGELEALSRHDAQGWLGRLLGRG
jgi:hypothetical protein